MRLSKLYNFETARRGARRALPPVLFDFIDGGSEDELTLAENHRAYQRIGFRPRQAVSIPEPDTSTTVLGASLSMPLALAPCGGSRLVYPDGERALIRAAGAMGTAATVSTASGTTLEDEAAAATGPVWFQLYYPGYREAAESLIERASRAGFGALFITVDMPIRGNQERVRSAERMVPPRPNLRNAIRYAPQLGTRPRWTYRYVRDGMPNGVNAKSSTPATALVPAGPGVTRANVTWDDVAWMRDLWKGPFVVKGILTAEDARRAVGAGADAVVVSNHGGRQLDGAPATIKVVPEVRAAVGSAIEVLVDGGVRRGADVLKALALGANAALIGRPYVYGLAVGGELGVRRVLELFRDDFTRTLKLLGRPSTADIDATCVDTSALLASLSSPEYP